MGARRSMGKQYDGVCARDRQPIPRPIDVDAAPRDARARDDADAMTDTKRAVDADDARDETRAKKPKAATTKSDAARRIQPGTRALSDGRRACVVVAWNIAGLRSFYDKSLERLEALVRREDPDVVVMQEHKLQVAHAGAFTEKLRKRFFKQCLKLG